MIIGLICDCASSLPLFRQFLQGHHIQDYLSTPVYRGNKAKAYIESYELNDIAEYVKKRSAFVIILGEDGEDVDWVDINNAKLTQELKAKAILERFA